MHYGMPRGYTFSRVSAPALKGHALRDAPRVYLFARKRACPAGACIAAAGYSSFGRLCMYACMASATTLL